MTDNLVKRLRDLSMATRNPTITEDPLERAAVQAADRIDALSAALTESQDHLDRWINTSASQYQTIIELQEALTQSRAETAAAYERAADEIDCCGCYGNCLMPSACFAIEAKNIRALATPDQTAARDQMIAEADARGMRRAADIAKWVASDACDIPDEIRGAAMVECAILAAIPKGGDA